MSTDLPGNLPTIEIADSTFVGFVKSIEGVNEAEEFQKALKEQYPSAAHIPLSWVLKTIDNQKGSIESGYDEDGEPLESAGPFMVQELKKQLIRSPPRVDSNLCGLALVVVRFFGSKLLGLTCGRLSQCYESISKISLHRFSNGVQQIPMHLEFGIDKALEKSLYGLGAGDCELILNILPPDLGGQKIKCEEDPSLLAEQVVNELNFTGFRGSKGETLPRKQNLQANLSSGVIPIYRYPGNYSGDEWRTYEWSPISLRVKDAVEKALLPLVSQNMNHCVCNYYREGSDFIDHHSDKDLDLDKSGVIVSVSLGDERVLELKRRTDPRDITRVVLPHGSMLVLGPNTNKQFTHSILKKEGSKRVRVSLTFRHVTTYMDLRTGHLFGQGVSASSLKEVRRAVFEENATFCVGFGTLTALLSYSKSVKKIVSRKLDKNELIGVIGGLFVLTFVTFRSSQQRLKRQEEVKQARAFFSSTSVNGTKY